MKQGKFLVVNEPSSESVDQKLKYPAEKCDIFPAQIYVPKSHKKSEKGLFCVAASIVQIIVCIAMTVFFSWWYLIPVVIEIAFFTMYAKEHVAVLTAQIFFLSATLIVTAAVLVISCLPETSGVYSDLSFILPGLEVKVLVPLGLFFGAFICVRILCVVSYRTQLFYSNLRDKFITEKVILQPL